MLQQLYPEPVGDVDVYDAYRPRDPDRPLVRINMVSALDGHIVDAGGVSGGLGGEGDHSAFVAMRHHADGIVAGAGTVRAEGYGPMRIRRQWAARRAADGKDGPAPIVIVTRSVMLAPAAPIFTAAAAPTMVLTVDDAPADRLQAMRRAGAVVVQAGEGDVDLAAGFQILREEHGLGHLLVEGGPTLNSQIVAAGLAQELCVTLAPVLAGGHDAGRLVDGLGSGRALSLAKILEHDGELLLTYRF